jgi:hypothetical protein
MARLACFLSVALCAVWSAGTLAGEALTLDEALREAHAANARLPVAVLDVAISREARREAHAERWLKTTLEADFTVVPPSDYDTALSDSGVDRLQIVGRQPLIDGGARRAGIARAEAASRRTRPVVMTILAGAFALAPLALALGEGSQLQQPLAIAVIGGFVLSGPIVLMILPALYAWIDPRGRLAGAPETR